jgi:hypothetical protein
VTAAPFATAAGAGEVFFYSLFDGIKETPFADTLSFLMEYTGHQIAVGAHEAAVHAVPAVHHLWELLLSYYHDNPLEIPKLFVTSFEALTSHDPESTFGLLRHAFDAGHLHVYGEAMAPVVHPLTDSLTHSFVAAKEHLGQVDLDSFTVPHDAALPHFHFPFITLAISATREIRLLSEDKTTIGSAIANASLDIAGTSAGGLGGAKLGAIVGSFLAPGAGTIVGGAVGGMIGALAARFATNAVKEIPLKNAAGVYEQKVSSMESETTAGAHRLYNGASTLMSRAQQDYLKAIGHVEPISKAVLPLGSEVRELAGAIRAEFRLSREALARQYQKSLEAIPPDSWYHFLFGGTGATITKDQLRNAYLAKDRELQAGESQIPSDEACSTDPLYSLQRIASLQSLHNQDHESKLANATQNVRLIKAAYLSSLLVWARNAAHHYQDSMKNAQVAIGKEAERFQALCEQWMREVQAAVADVKVELAKLGRA